MSPVKWWQFYTEHSVLKGVAHELEIYMNTQLIYGNDEITYPFHSVEPLK